MLCCSVHFGATFPTLTSPLQQPLFCLSQPLLTDSVFPGLLDIQTCSNTHMNQLITGAVPLYLPQPCLLHLEHLPSTSRPLKIQSRGRSERVCTRRFLQPSHTQHLIPTAARHHSTSLQSGVAAGYRGASSLHPAHFPNPRRCTIWRDTVPLCFHLS